MDSVLHIHARKVEADALAVSLPGCTAGPGNPFFIKAKLRKKIIILVAGVTMNFIVAWMLFSFIFWQGTRPISFLPENAVKSETHSYLIPTYSFLEER